MIPANNIIRNVVSDEFSLFSFAHCSRCGISMGCCRLLLTAMLMPISVTDLFRSWRCTCLPIRCQVNWEAPWKSITAPGYATVSNRWRIVLEICATSHLARRGFSHRCVPMIDWRRTTSAKQVTCPATTTKTTTETSKTPTKTTKRSKSPLLCSSSRLLTDW